MRTLTTGDGNPPAVLSQNMRVGFAFIESGLKGKEVFVSAYDEKTGIRSTNRIPYEEFIEMANEMIKACEEHDGVHD